jgi:ligand-binding sensor domain-containing protein/signal transduction histidine kinase
MSRRSYTSFALVSAFTTLAIPLFGQAKQVRFVQLPVVTEEHLRFYRLPWPSTRVITRKIIQDNQGFLWLGAADGLRRYDGYSFMRVAQDDEGNSLGFINSESLMKDRSGAFWFGIDGFLARYDPASGHLRRYRTIGGPTCRDSGCDAHQITEDQEGIIWLATNNGLVRLDPATSRLIYYQHRPDDDSTISSDTVICTIEARDGLLWIASSGALDALDRHTGKVMRRIRFETESAGHLSLYGFPANLYEDRSGMLWAGMSSGGDLASIDTKTAKTTVYSFRAPGSQKSAPAFVVSISEDQEGALWLGTTGLGLLKFEHDRGRVVWYESNPEDPNSLSGDLVVGLFRDSEGSFWTFTKGGDVSRFDPRPPVFRSYRHEPGNKNSLIDSAVISAYEDSNGTLWIGTERGLNRIDRRTGRVKRYENVEFASGVRSIAEDRDRSLWFGTRGNGLVRFDRRTEAMRVFRHRRDDPRSLSNDYVAALLVDRQGRLWAATDSGLSRYDEKTEQFQSFTPDEKRPARYHSIAEGPNGALWLASSEFGLHRFRPSTGEFTEFHFKPGDSGALSHDHVYSVYADKSGTIWAATFAGLDKFNPAKADFTHYDARNGLPTNTALGVLEDAGGYLWISTPDGLARFDPRTATGVGYYAADGLPTDMFNTLVVAVKSGSGEMFFGSYDGLTAFFPEQVIEHRSVPPVVLTNFRLFGEPVRLGKGTLKRPIWSTNLLELPQRSIFSFDFSALSYVDPSRTRYRFRLEGLESKWNETDSSHRIATYTTLPVGYYTLQVQARTSRGDWSENGVTLNIRILPPWYGTWWFRSLGAVSFFALICLFYRLRLHQIAREFSARIEERVYERTRIARELHDTLLQSVQGLMFSFQAARNFLPERSEEAARALDDAISQGDEAIAESRDAIQGLRANPSGESNLESLLTAEANQLARSSGQDGKPPDFRTILEGARQPLSPLFQDEVYRIAREILRNAFRHAHASRIEAEIAYDRQFFRLRIRDNGNGIDRKVLEEGARQGHWGLAGIRERAKQIGARLKLWSELGAGTEAELTVPARIAYSRAHGRKVLRLFRKN